MDAQPVFLRVNGDRAQPQFRRRAEDADGDFAAIGDEQFLGGAARRREGPGTGGRIGAGALTDSRLFNRFGQGFVVSQLITDSGRTPNLVANSRLRAQASAQDYQGSRYDVLLAVDRSYFDYLHAQALVKVADAPAAALGIWLDQHHPGKHAWTLALLAAGLAIGCLNAWHWVAKEDKEIRDEQADKE